MNTYKLVACDTDSIKFCKTDMSPMSNQETVDILKRLNDKLPDLMILENDGLYDKMLVVKSKNYMTKIGDKTDIKGSALKATMKEKALREFLEKTLDYILSERKDDVIGLYNKYVVDIKNLTDISPWCSKKTVTAKVLNPKRTNEERVLAALEGENIQEGDKYRMFFKSNTELCLEKNFDGVYDADRLYEKLFKTVKVLEPVLGLEGFLNFKLKKNKDALEAL